jgi:hypothetical protein
MPVYAGDQWRTVVIMNLVRLRQAIYDVSVILGCITLGVALDKLWDWAFVVGGPQ